MQLYEKDNPSQCTHQIIQKITFVFFFYSFNRECALHRPSERSGEDVDIILTRLREVKAFQRFPPPLLLQICACAFYECLEKGITCMYMQTRKLFCRILKWFVCHFLLENIWLWCWPLQSCSKAYCLLRLFQYYVITETFCLVYYKESDATNLLHYFRRNLCMCTVDYSVFSLVVNSV